MAETPKYVAKQSAWGAVKFKRVIGFILIVPLIITICDIIQRKHRVVEFYDNYIIQRSGVFSKKESRSAFLGVYGVSVNQKLWQRMCKCGNIVVDTVTKWDVISEDIVNPRALKAYLETRLVTPGSVTPVIHG